MENNDLLQENLENPVTPQTTTSSNEPVATAIDPIATNLSIETTATSTDMIHDALPEEFEDEHIDEHEDIIEDYNTFNKKQLIDALKELIKSEDFVSIKNKVAAVRVAFWNIIQQEKEEKLAKLTEEGEKEDKEIQSDPSIEKFNHLFGQYRDKRSKHLQQQEKDKDKNLEIKLQILENIKVLIDSEESLKKTYDDLKDLQNKWKEVGPVPKNENDNLWKSYHFLIEKFLDKVKINKELKDLDLKKNLEIKLELCEKVELLVLESSIMKSFKELQRLHDQWKATGPVSSDKSNEIWDRFCAASEKIHERRREHYNNQQEERENNLIAKIAICEKIEEINTRQIKNLREWKDTSEEILNLQDGWKTIGFATEKQNDEIWKRFRAAINSFFDTKKEYFDKIQDEYTTNLNHKIELCVQAESLKDSTDWNYTARDLINLQKRWKQIGPVSQKQSDAIWKRFRSACDYFFTHKEEYFKNIDSIEATNLAQKEDLIKRIIDFTPVEDNKLNIETLKNFQRDWTESGHVPMAQKDHIYADYRDAINKGYEKLNMSASEAGIVAFKSRIEPLFGSDEGERIIEKEVQNLRKIIQKLSSDVALWGNNIGYLAKSKNADIVRNEFEKKIEHAQKELKLSEEKLKFLTRRPKPTN